MNYHPEDRPDPTEQPIRARVPDHVAGGCFSTGVIVMTAQTEFILDFVQNLGRPHQIVARVVLPHGVLPQLVDALHRNIELYRTRWGELPQIATSKPAANSGGSLPEVSQIDTATLPPAEPSTSPPTDSAAPGIPGSTGVSPPPQSSQSGTPAASAGHSEARPSNTERPAPNPPREDSTGSDRSENTTRQASAQEIYDDLKIRDELLSGVYANAVMIGHGPHEFSFDFITNFYPNSAVSARVFLAAGQIPRLHDSLKGTWEQLRRRMNPPPDYPPPSDF